MPSKTEIIQNKRFYTFGDAKLPSVTTILDLAYQKEWMEPWIAKIMAAEAASGTSRSKEDFLGAKKRSTIESREHGDDIHSKFSHMIKGGYTDFAPLQEWRERYRPDIEYSEASVYNLDVGYAGTLDMIAVVKGKRYLIDLKTGANLDASLKLQLSAYKNATTISNNQFQKGMPTVDACAILWIPRNTPEEWTFREVSVGSREFRAFLACVDIANYHIANSNVSILGRVV